jgi:hypothetical protein
LFTLVSLGVSTVYFLFALSYGSFSQALYPQWLYYLNALIILIMWLIPTLDERQTRRTGRASPLSEFLRNGVHGPLSLLVRLLFLISLWPVHSRIDRFCLASPVRLPVPLIILVGFRYLLPHPVGDISYWSLSALVLGYKRSTRARCSCKCVVGHRVLVFGLASTYSPVFPPEWTNETYYTVFHRSSVVILTISSLATFFRGSKALWELHVHLLTSCASLITFRVLKFWQVTFWRFPSV